MEKEKNKEELKSIRRKIYSIILPVAMENILQMTASFVSMGMVGRIDPVAVGALGLSTRITQIVWALFKGITTGATVFVAQAFGAGDSKKLMRVIQQTLISTIILVFLLQQLIYWKAPMLLGIFKPGADLAASGLIYLRIVSFGLPFMAIMLVVAGVLQGMGNAKTPMKIAFIMNLVNIVLSYILIFGNLGFSPLKLKGAAIALASAQFAGAVIGLYVLFNRDGVLGQHRKGLLNLDFKEISQIYRVGMPTAFESIFWQLAAIILTKVILSFGEIALASYQLGLQAESISYMPAAGFAIAATTFTGQSLGAQNHELGRKYLRETIKGSILLTLISAGALLFFPKAIMGILTNNADVIKLGSIYLILMGLVQIPQNLSGVLSGALRGAGFTRVPMIVAGTGLWGIRVPFSLILTYYFKLSIVSIWVVICFDLVFRFILSFVLYKSKDIFSKGIVLVKKDVEEHLY